MTSQDAKVIRPQLASAVMHRLTVAFIDSLAFAYWDAHFAVCIQVKYCWISVCIDLHCAVCSVRVNA